MDFILFDEIEDLVSIERINDVDSRIDNRAKYLLHLKSNRFIIVANDLHTIIGEGKDHFLYRNLNYSYKLKYFSVEEKNNYAVILAKRYL